jgi:peptidoglycan/xylan/chitin deacetylase (PgdA/CDA1 family)
MRIGNKIGVGYNKGAPVSLRAYWTTPLKDGHTKGVYDWAELSTIDKDVTTNKVARWDDLLGTKRYLTHAATGSRPTWSATDGVKFNKDSWGWLKTPTFEFHQPSVIYMLMRQTNWTANRLIMDGYTAEAGSITQKTSSPNLAAYTGAAYTDLFGGLAINTWAILKIAYDGANSYLQVNDDEPMVFTSTGTKLLHGLILGNYGGNPVAPSSIDVKCIILRDVVDGVAKDQQIKAILNSRLDADSKGARSLKQFNNGKLVLTFDDGKWSQYTTLLPILLEKNITATFYIIGNTIANSDSLDVNATTYLTRGQLQALYAAGMDIQCHSMSLGAAVKTATQEQVDADFTALNDYFTSIGIPIPYHHAMNLGLITPLSKITVSNLRRTMRAYYSPTYIKANVIYPDNDLFELWTTAIDSLAAATITAIKANIDEAVLNKYAMTLTGHSIDQAGEGNVTTAASLIEIIDYAQASGIDIITISQLYELMEH